MTTTSESSTESSAPKVWDGNRLGKSGGWAAQRVFDAVQQRHPERSPKDITAAQRSLIEQRTLERQAYNDQIAALRLSLVARTAIVFAQPGAEFDQLGKRAEAEGISQFTHPDQVVGLLTDLEQEHLPSAEVAVNGLLAAFSDLHSERLFN